MNAEQAIEILTHKRDHDIFTGTEYTRQVHDALDMAIEALKAQEKIRCESCTYMSPDNCEECKTVKQEPKTDRIEYGADGNLYNLSISNGKEYEQERCKDCIFIREWEKIGKLISIILEKQTEQEPKTEWIPVSERLPEDGTWNIFTNGKNISIERYKTDALDHFYPSGRWFPLEEAIAWMPLPEPYKESEG